MPTIGPMELIIVLVVALLVVGPRKLPGLGRSAGSNLREFKEALAGASPSDVRSSDNGGDSAEVDPDTVPRRPR